MVAREFRPRGLLPGELRAVFDRVEFLHSRDVKHAVHRRRGRADWALEVDRRKHLLLATCGHDPKITFARTEVELAVSNQRRGPEIALRVLHPDGLARSEFDAVNVATRVRGEDQAIKADRRCERVLVEGIRPDLSLTRGIDAFQPRVVLAPENIAAASDEQAFATDHWH